MPKVHLWPLAEARRLATNSSTNESYKLALTKFVDNLIFMRARGDVVARVGDLYDSWHSIKRASAKMPIDGRVVALVMNYHPLLHSAGLQKVIDRVAQDLKHELSWMLRHPVKVRVVFRTAGERLAVCMRKL